MTRLILTLAVFSLASAQDDGKVENPDYKGWAGQKVGAWVAFTRVEETGGTNNEITVTVKLTVISPEKAVIDEMVESEVGGIKVVTHGIRALPARIKKGTDSEGSKVESIAKGEEEIEIKAAKLKCAWVKMKVTVNDGPMTMKVWRHDTIIGGTAKVVMNIEKPEKKNITMTATDWKAGD